MKLLGYEIKKLAMMRFCLVFTAGLFILNVFFAFRAHPSLPEAGETPWTQRVDGVIRQADFYLSELEARGTSPDTYIVRLENDILTAYRSVRDNTTPDHEKARGWDAFFAGSGGDLFLLLAVLVNTVGIVTVEDMTGMRPVIRTVKHGSVQLIFAKLACVFLVVLTLFLCFIGGRFAAAGIREGYSSPFDAAQKVEALALCPASVSILEIAVRSCLVKLVTCLLIAAVSACIVVILPHPAFAFACCAVIYGLNVLADKLPVLNADRPLARLNFLAASRDTELFGRFSAVNLLGFPRQSPNVILVLYPALALLFFGSCILLWGKRPRHVKLMLSKRASRIPRIFSARREKRQKPRIYSVRLFRHEAAKAFFVSPGGWVMLFVISLKLVYAADAVPNQTSYADTAYREYMEILAGKLTEEKRQFLREERDRISEALLVHESMQNGYLKGEIDWETYTTHISAHTYAQNRKDVFARVQAHAAYIERMAERGREVWFVYDTGWEKLIFAPFDVFLYALLLLFHVGSFALEYGSSSFGYFVPILRTAKRGRGLTFAAKTGSALLFSVLFGALFFGIDCAAVCSRYVLPLAFAPAGSVESLADFSFPVSLIGFAALVFAVKLFAALMLTILVTSLSALLGNRMGTLAVVSAATLFPHLLVLSGLKIPEQTDFCRLMRGAPVLLDGADRSVVMWFGMSAIILTVWAAWRWESRRE